MSSYYAQNNIWTRKWGLHFPQALENIRPRTRRIQMISTFQNVPVELAVANLQNEEICRGRLSDLSFGAPWGLPAFSEY